jgi:hypothetical protein
MPQEKDVRTVLAEAIKKRDELNTFIRLLQEMMGDDSAREPETTDSTSTTQTAAVSDPMSIVFPGMFFGKSQPQAAKLLLDQVKRPLKTKTILECLRKGGLEAKGKKPLVNLWTSLNRDKATFVLVPKAGWGLYDWYDPKIIAVLAVHHEHRKIF